MVDPDITMSIEDTLELDTIINSTDSSSLATVTDGTEGSDFEFNVIETQTEIFDPKNSGTYNIDVNGQTLTVEVVNSVIIPDSGISQEEDGDLSNYTGTTSYFTTTKNPTVSGSDYAISFSNSTSNSEYVENTFDYGQVDKISMYLYPEDNNNEVVFIDSSNGNVIFCIYFRSRDDTGIYYSAAKDSRGSIQNTGSNPRINGTTLVSGSNTNTRYYHIEIQNINWSDKTVDIAVDGSIVATDKSFILSGVPDILQLNSSYGGSSNRTGGYIDKIDGR